MLSTNYGVHHYVTDRQIERERERERDGGREK
jgi:hypothetical protein